jgi:DNA-binding NtrC family response regulator
MEKIKVLLVDDEEEFICTLAERLELRNIDTLTATNGDQAIHIVEKEIPPVVVLDVKMPGIGGVEVMQQIKRSHPQIQIILLTGHGSTQDGIKGMRLGAFDYLMKPVKIDDLIDKMHEAIKASRPLHD